jgi:hypothetical protein
MSYRVPSVQPRADSLAVIDEAIRRIAERVRSTIQGAQITEGKLEEAVVRL